MLTLSNREMKPTPRTHPACLRPCGSRSSTPTRRGRHAALWIRAPSPPHARRGTRGAASLKGRLSARRALDPGVRNKKRTGRDHLFVLRGRQPLAPPGGSAVPRRLRRRVVAPPREKLRRQGGAKRAHRGGAARRAAAAASARMQILRLQQMRRRRQARLACPLPRLCRRGSDRRVSPPWFDRRRCAPTPSLYSTHRRHQTTPARGASAAQPRTTRRSPCCAASSPACETRRARSAAGTVRARAAAAAVYPPPPPMTWARRPPHIQSRCRPQ